MIPCLARFRFALFVSHSKSQSHRNVGDGVAESNAAQANTVLNSLEPIVSRDDG